MKKIFLTAILFLFIFSCEVENSEEIKEKENTTIKVVNK